MSFLNVGTLTTSVGVQLPVFTDASRPSNPQIGLMIFNSTIKEVEIYTTDGWKPVGRDLFGTAFNITAVQQGGSGVGNTNRGRDGTGGGGGGAGADPAAPYSGAGSGGSGLVLVIYDS